MLAAAGADVVVTGTGRDPATFPADEKAVNWHDVHSTVEQIEAQGRRGLALIGDISQQTDVSRMVQQTLATFGRVDMLINNAAIARGVDRVPVVELSAWASAPRIASTTRLNERVRAPTGAG